MLPPFRTRSSHSFERDIRRLTKRNPTLLLRVKEAAAILSEDPCNTTGRYNIKKLNAVASGEVSGESGLEIIEFAMMFLVLT